MSPLEASLNTLVGDDTLVAWKLRALLTGYAAHWSFDEMTVLSVEEKFRLPIINPETGRSSRTFVQGGKFDGAVEIEGRVYMVEHKTASEEIINPNLPYWRRLAIDSQVSMYALANWQDGRKLDGTLYDVIRKPTIRPKQIPKKEQKELLEKRVYCKIPVSDVDIAASAATEYRETPRLYSLRLLNDIRDNPARYFQRRMVPRLDSEIAEWAGELWQVAQDIRSTQLSEGHYRNSGACMNYGRPCEYLGLCSGHDEPESGKWQKRTHCNPEVEMGEDTLTHSRIRCYQTCKRKHHYKYDLLLEKADEEEAEALYFGSLMHRALEAFYSQLKETQHGNCHPEPAASEAAGCAQQTLAF